jgi:hypothetical protein
MGPLHAASEGEDECLDGISLVVRQTVPVRRLPGFAKAKHRVPDVQDRRAQEFVARLGWNLVRRDLDAAFAGLRSVMGLKRRQLEVTESDEGFGTIQTPHFLYSNSVSQSEVDASLAIWQRELSRIVSAEVIRSENCNRLFAEVFDTIEFVPARPISLEKLVDHIEELGDDRVHADYDRGLTYCQLSIDQLAVTIHVQRESFCVAHPAPTGPGELLRCLQDLQHRLVDFRDLA